MRLGPVLLLAVASLCGERAEATWVSFADVPNGTLARDQYLPIGLRIEGAGAQSGLAIDEGDYGTAGYGNTGPRFLHVGQREEPTLLRFVTPTDPDVVQGADSISFLVGDGDPDEETFSVTWFGVTGATLLGPVSYTTSSECVQVSGSEASLGAPIGSIEVRLLSTSSSGVTLDDVRFQLAGTTPPAPIPVPGGDLELYTDASLTESGLVGTYIDASLRTYEPQDDWRETQSVAGNRTDLTIDFDTPTWGSRAEVGVTGGTDEDWDQFSVQWDGYVRILGDGVRLSTLSDDGSRMWIDVDGDGLFASTPPEFADNHWGAGQPTAQGDYSPPLPAGVYRIRIQYYDDFFGSIVRLAATPEPTVRFAYLIPANKDPQPNGIANLEAEVVPLLRGWYCDQMERNGVGRFAPRFERDASDAFHAHMVEVPATPAMLRAGTGEIQRAAAEAGARGSSGQIWVFFLESHEQLASGEILGGIALGEGGGSGLEGGTAYLGTQMLGFASRQGLLDNRAYAGLVIPAIGPYPLVQDVSFPWFEGTTISSLTSSLFGAIGHEMTHAFGIAHDSRNDALNGNLMFNGLRGFRGALFPQRFPTQHTRLEWSTAQALALNAYFESCDPNQAPPVGESLQSDDRPALSVSSPSSTPVAGQVVVEFTASDPDGLAFAILLRGGGQVDEMPLQGIHVSASLRSPWFEPGVPESFEVHVYDEQGNRAVASTTIVASPGLNQAPNVFLELDRSQAATDRSFTLTSQSLDPESPAEQLAYEWQIEEGGPFVSTGALSEVSVSYPTPGDRLLRMRVRDTDGAVSTTTPIAVRVAAACSDGLDNDADGRIDFDGGASHPGAAGTGDPDANCGGPNDNTEHTSCGLGAEIALVLAAIRARRRRECGRGSSGRPRRERSGVAKSV